MLHELTAPDLPSNLKDILLSSKLNENSILLHILKDSVFPSIFASLRGKSLRRNNKTIYFPGNIAGYFRITGGGLIICLGGGVGYCFCGAD